MSAGVRGEDEGGQRSVVGPARGLEGRPARIHGRFQFPGRPPGRATRPGPASPVPGRARRKRAPEGGGSRRGGCGDLAGRRRSVSSRLVGGRGELGGLGRARLPGQPGRPGPAAESVGVVLDNRDGRRGVQEKTCSNETFITHRGPNLRANPRPGASKRRQTGHPGAAAAPGARPPRAQTTSHPAPALRHSVAKYAELNKTGARSGRFRYARWRQRGFEGRGGGRGAKVVPTEALVS